MALVAVASNWVCAAAGALILSPTTVAGPGPATAEFGGVAVSADGTGGIVYTAEVDGVPHVFASRYANGGLRPPVRVDWDTPYGATYPRIAAADGGRLLVVWVSQIATIGGRVQRALYSSTLQPGASGFGAPIIVDPDVGEGEGVDPSLALAASGQGLVAYRAVTDNFTTSLVQTTIPRLRPGDVLADIRIARYESELWSSAVNVNRDSRLSMRAPNEDNGPQVGIGRGDEAVVAWQEPESNGAARIWARRVFGTTLGLALQASPTSLDGQPISTDAEAFALGVSNLGEAKVVSLVTGTPGTAIERARLFVNTLPVSTQLSAAQFGGAQLLQLGGSRLADPLGVPSVAVDDQGDYRIAFTAAGAPDVLAGAETNAAGREVALGPGAARSDTGAVTTLNPEGGGTAAWPASNAAGAVGVGVREDFSNGASQSALLSGKVDGPVSQLGAGGSESGEALVGFREGVPGAYEIVAVPVTVPPPAFFLEAPSGWVTPVRARLAWSSAEDATGGVTYSLILDGRIVKHGISGLSALPNRRLLGSGVHHVQILATDASGQQTLSPDDELKVDGSPPVVTVRMRGDRTVLVSVKDRMVGAVARDTLISFGDGAHASGRLKVAHTYVRPGRYVVVVRTRDRLGNQGTAHLRVIVG